MKWLDRIPYVALIFFAILLGLAPFKSTPHLVEKLNMLASGTLQRPIDIFDLFLHSAPLILLAIKTIRDVRQRQ